jgi:hypothetical protein
MTGLFRRIGRSFRGRLESTGAPLARLCLELLEVREVPAAPLAPTGLVAVGASASSIALTWTPPPDLSVTGYDVYEKVHHVIHQPKGTGRSYDTYNLIASNLTTPADTITGLAIGSSHTYLVTSVNASGQSIYSAPALGMTWVAPRFTNGSNTVLLSSGAVWSSPVSATAGLTTQVSLLVAGNPLTFSVISRPPTMSIDARTGVVTYTPGTGEVGPVTATFQVSNLLGTISQTVLFKVSPGSNLPQPTLRLNASTATYTGQYQQVSATAIGADGVTPVAGLVTIAYNGGKGGYPLNVGSYPVLVTFTSSDPNYGNATLLATYTITPATPAFNYLSSPAIAVGAATAKVSGSLSAGTAVPAGEFVIVTLNGVAADATVDAYGNFSASFATATLPAGDYSVGYSFAGTVNFTAAANATSTLTVVSLAAPTVTLNPRNTTTSEGDGVSFTAAATGSPGMTAQWQVSTDGGQTWTNVTGNTSAKTTTLTFTTTSLSQNGYKYRAVFANSAGSVTTSAATLTVEPND